MRVILTYELRIEQATRVLISEIDPTDDTCSGYIRNICSGIFSLHAAN